jgi:hypothetical protein
MRQCRAEGIGRLHDNVATVVLPQPELTSTSTGKASASAKATARQVRRRASRRFRRRSWRSFGGRDGGRGVKDSPVIGRKVVQDKRNSSASIRGETILTP